MLHILWLRAAAARHNKTCLLVLYVLHDHEYIINHAVPQKQATLKTFQQDPSEASGLPMHVSLQLPGLQARQAAQHA